GPNPVQWAIIDDARETAVTLHRMTDRVDAGDIVAERRVPVHFIDTWRAVSDRLRLATEELLADEIPRVLTGRASGRPQDASAARVWPRRRADDGRIDWSWSVLRVYNQVRALGDGIPPAFYELGDERVPVERLSIAEVAALLYAPGPGGRRLGRDGLELRPAGGELVSFRILCAGSEAGECGVEPLD